MTQLRHAIVRRRFMQFVIVEKFLGGDLTSCYQIMECDDRTLLDEWMANWRDLVDFEVIPAMTSAEAAAVVAPRL